MQLLLDVPRQSQYFDPQCWREHGFTGEDEAHYWGGRACGIACAAMVIEFLTAEPVPRHTLLHEARALGAYSPRGWVHAGLARLLNRRGVSAEAEPVEHGDLPRYLTAALHDGPVIASVARTLPTDGLPGRAPHPRHRPHPHTFGLIRCAYTRRAPATRAQAGQALAGRAAAGRAAAGRAADSPFQRSRPLGRAQRPCVPGTLRSQLQRPGDPHVATARRAARRTNGCGRAGASMIEWEDLLAAVPEAEILRPGPLRYSRASVDTRTITGGELFFAVPGPARDGHDFVAAAVDAGDPGQISRYENGKITPSVEAVIRLAELFDVSTDYLLVEGEPRRPYRQADDPLAQRLADLDQLTEDDRAAVLHILDGLLANTRIRAALNTAAS